MQKYFPLILVAQLLAAAPSRAADPAALLAAQRATTLGTDAREVRDVELDARLATVRLDQGWLFPVLGSDGQPTTEVVFRGRGRLTLAPTDPVEAAQLEVFTDADQLDEPFSEAVFVIADPAARATLFAPPASPPAADESSTARALHERWRSSRERVLMGTPAALWRIGLGEKLFDGYFAAYLRTENHGTVLYLVDPEADEQVTLGRFVPLELDRKEERKLRRQLHREQRQGRFVGLELEDLGSWDTWFSSPLAAHGQATFEPRHYDLKVHVAPGGEITGTVKVELTATSGGARTVAFKFHPLTKIAAVRDAAGAAVPHAIEESSLVAFLATAPAAGETVELSFDFSGPFLERLNSFRSGGDIWYLPDTVHWYPHTGNVDRATYEADVTTEVGTVVAPGAPAGSEPGKTGHFLLDRPTFGFTFEVGRFKTYVDTQGEVPITLHLDSAWREFAVDGKQVVADARRALDYLQEIFGPLPHDRLTLVSAPRGFSQSFPGHLVMSDIHLSERWSPEDPRTVVAHELAHQWWGHQADFGSYRDQWLSEALANYASVQFRREKLLSPTERPRLSPTDDWQAALLRLTANGMPVENLGPVVLGGRLDSSIADAYAAIVYLKGALIIDSLHNLVGADKFLTALRKVLVDPASKELTTAEFLAALERHSGVSVKAFADRFIYDVGLPEVSYSYRFEPAEAGKWAVVGQARQQAPYHYRYRLQATPDGLPDVRRETIERAQISQTSTLAVPVEIGYLQPDVPPPSRKLNRAEQKAWEERQAREGNALLRGRTVLRGAEPTFRFEAPGEPRRLWFDRHEEIFCLFYDERRFPKRGALLRGIDLAATGHRAEAETAFREALAAPLSTDPEPEHLDPYQRTLKKAEVHSLDRWSRQRLVRLLLDTDRLSEAAAELELAKQEDRSRMPLWQKHEERTLEARIALRQGKPERVLGLLSGGFAKRQVTTREGQALLAVAAWATGDAKTLAEARKASEKAGIDLSLLDQPPPGRR